MKLTKTMTALLFLFAILNTGCLVDSTGPDCVPESTQVCYCSDGTTGSQSCYPSGNLWTRCSCTTVDPPPRTCTLANDVVLGCGCWGRRMKDKYK